MLLGMNTHPKTGVALVLSAAALWGTTGTAQSFASGALSSLWFGALRLLVAALFFATCFALRRPRDAAPTAAPQALPLLALLGAGLSMAVYNLSFFGGVRLAGVAVGTAIALGSGPVWAGVLQSLLARQVPGAPWWLGTALAVGGGVLMTLAGGGSAQGGVDFAGVALCLLAGLSYAVYTLASQRLLRAAPPAAVTLYAFGVAAALALPAAWWESGVPAFQGADLPAVLYVGVATAGVAYLLYSHALRHIAAASAVTLALAEPVVAFMLAVVVVGERPSAWAFLGLLLVVAGVLAVVRNELAAAGRQGRQGEGAAPAPDAASSRELSPARR